MSYDMYFWRQTKDLEMGLEQIINACCSLGCALYDPQTGRRYEQPEPNTEA